MSALTWCLLVAVSKAFSTLSDGNKRAAYDRYGDTEGTVNGQRQHAAGPNFGGEGFDPEEIFNMFFNGGFGGGGGFGARYTLACAVYSIHPQHHMYVQAVHCKSTPSRKRSSQLKLSQKQRLELSGFALPGASPGKNKRKWWVGRRGNRGTTDLGVGSINSFKHNGAELAVTALQQKE